MPAETMTTGAAARLLGVSVDTIVRLYHAGTLRGYRVSDRPRSHIRLYTASVEAYEKQRQSQHPPGQ